MEEDWMTIFREMTGGRDLEAMVKKYLIEDIEVEPTEEEIHAERSERFVQDNHIVCPFEGYEELHADEPVEVEDDELAWLFEDYDDEEEGDYRPRQNTEVDNGGMTIEETVVDISSRDISRRACNDYEYWDFNPQWD